MREASSDAGWTLTALNADNTCRNLQRQGLRLYTQDSGLPWVPEAYTLTAPDGTAYELDAAGRDRHPLQRRRRAGEGIPPPPPTNTTPPAA